MKMRIAICDDEKKDCELLHDYCKCYDNNLSIHNFSSGAQLLKAFKDCFYDLIFLDIEMDSPNGYEVGMKLAQSSKKPIIVFTTKTINYAVRGYGVAFRYLLKPIKYETFVSVLRLAAEKILPEKITVTKGDSQLILNISDIIFIEVILHKVIFHLQDGNSLTIRGTLTNVMSQIKRSWFVQAHKSYYVNMDYIDRMSQKSFFLTDGTEIPIGSKRLKNVQEKLNMFLRSKSKL